VSSAQGRPTTAIDYQDRNGHGTACTTLLLAVAPACAVIPIRIFDESLETTPDILEAALRWAGDRGIKLINLSLGTLRKDAAFRLFQVCNWLRDLGTIIVAAGVFGKDAWSFPAVFEPVLGVGVSDRVDRQVVEYTVGAAVECRVKGERILRGLDGRYRVSNATSFATPIVTGLIARWLEEEPFLNVDGVRKRLSRGGWAS
jgi:hypothetical protein